MNHQEVTREFPNLLSSDFSIESPRTIEYNCIAWAAGETDRWWWPGYYYWPPGVPRTATLQAFIRAFKSLGYEVCQNDNHENAFEKVAIYTNINNIPTHAARQLTSGMWTSKLGNEEDIEHTLDGLVGTHYGSVAVIMKRPQKS